MHCPLDKRQAGSDSIPVYATLALLSSDGVYVISPFVLSIQFSPQLAVILTIQLRL